MSRIELTNGMTPTEWVAAINDNFAELFDTDYCRVTNSASTQSIPDSDWTVVELDSFIGPNTSDIYIEDNKVYFPIGDGDNAGGLWNCVSCVAWDNTAGGLARHVRKFRLVTAADNFAYPFTIASTEMVYDPAAGVSGEAARSSQVVYTQPGMPMESAGAYNYLEVWQNSGGAINLVKYGLSAPTMQLARLDDI